MRNTREPNTKELFILDMMGLDVDNPFLDIKVDTTDPAKVTDRAKNRGFHLDASFPRMELIQSSRWSDSGPDYREAEPQEVSEWLHLDDLIEALAYEEEDGNMQEMREGSIEVIVLQSELDSMEEDIRQIVKDNL